MTSEYNFTPHVTDTAVAEDEYLHTTFRSSMDGVRFSVELLIPDDVELMEQSPVALSFHARFDVEQVYHNSFLKHAWGQQEIPYWFPLQADAEFNITLQSDNQGFKVLAHPT
jgi:hypothetical protein